MKNNKSLKDSATRVINSFSDSLKSSFEFERNMKEFQSAIKRNSITKEEISVRVEALENAFHNKSKYNLNNSDKISKNMEYNFRIYYSKGSQMPCVEYADKDTVVLMKAKVLECNVPTFGIYTNNTAEGGNYWSMAGKANSIIQESDKITIE